MPMGYGSTRARVGVKFNLCLALILWLFRNSDGPRQLSIYLVNSHAPQKCDNTDNMFFFVGSSMDNFRIS